MKRIIFVLIMLLARNVFAADVKPALVEVFGNEGGYQCMKNDGGNWTGGRPGLGELRGTKYGIAASSYPSEDIRGLTLERAAELYRRDFWRPLRLDLVESQIIATEIFDGAVNMGVGTQARILQEAVNLAGGTANRVKVDGVVGPATIAALNRANPSAVYTCLIGERFARYKFLAENNPRLKQFFLSWILRVKSNVVKAVREVDKRGRS